MSAGDLVKADKIMQMGWAKLILLSASMPHYDDIEKGKSVNTPQRGVDDNFNRVGDKMVSKKMNLWALMDVMEQWQESKSK